LTPALGLSGLLGCCEETAIGRSDRPVLAAYLCTSQPPTRQHGQRSCSGISSHCTDCLSCRGSCSGARTTRSALPLNGFLGYNHSLSALSLPTARPPTNHSYFRAPSPENKILDAMKISMGQSAGQSIITIIKKSKNCASLVGCLNLRIRKAKTKF
jgi:hypothetical protein